MMSDTNQAALEAGFQEFPVLMAHPSFTQSESIPIPGSEIRGRNGEVIRQDYRGTPERLPPVTAMNADDEEYYRAQGYERAGKMDPAAWVKAHSSAPVETYKPEQYPVWREIDGVKTLIHSAAEDPEYDPAATVEEATEPKPEPLHQPDEAENLRAQMDAMQQVLAEMRVQSEALAAENERLVAGSQPDGSPPKAKRPYTRRQKAN